MSDYHDLIAAERPLRVILIDDHALFRMGLYELMERRGIKVVAAVGDGQAGLKCAKELEHDLILLDVRMPTMDGLETLRRLRATGVSAPVIILSTSNDDRDVVEALRHGAQGYLLKDMDPDALVAALHSILSGKTVVAPELAAVFARYVQGSDRPHQELSPFADLTPRELEILKHVAEGQSNKVIGRALGIVDGTVKLHVKSIMRKLGVHSRVEAAVIAVEKGLNK